MLHGRKDERRVGTQVALRGVSTYGYGCLCLGDMVASLVIFRSTAAELGIGVLKRWLQHQQNFDATHRQSILPSVATIC